MLRILHNTSWDFLKQWKLSVITVAVFVIPAVILIPIRGFNYSIEFTGGTQMELTFREAPAIADVRAAISGAGLGDAEIFTYGAPTEIVIRAQESQQVAQLEAGAEMVSQQIERTLQSRFGADAFVIGRTAAVSPRVGSELRSQAVIATLIAFALTLVYLAWRFEWRFGVAAVIATLHDLAASLAFMMYMDLEISIFVVGAVLTVIGYSMNDTVVVFDRVRENLRAHRKMPLYDLLNRSVNETLPRTVMTGTTTLATLLALLIFGGSVIRPFAWVLLFGILVGTFSSIYIASPLLLWIESKWPHRNEAAPQARAARA
ncbi:MAG: protein translocase subunit SecF [Gemmatimonadota bacterium]|jgi:preprotein translocase subunit SecF|nr:protein translocase subunit SecF [Gemmatimonadota bacterium]MDQ8150583.1 protein translocase subunit SecF [Gemmatimonadota bacterium]MDQ8151494.1 protein translocase subunit SecF [Gemmatimonadota bacterium]MDQ8173984.1 protein translocase subunit SecF [Gemmatimonadota bacterium]MDQ8178114.1 protein translocase subunit SecF [Gemmatimonadota bacterium]